MYGVAIIGCGQISDLHAAPYSGSDAVRIVALADRDRHAAEAKRDRWASRTRTASRSAIRR